MPASQIASFIGLSSSKQSRLYCAFAFVVDDPRTLFCLLWRMFANPDESGGYVIERIDIIIENYQVLYICSLNHFQYFHQFLFLA